MFRNILKYMCDWNSLLKSNHLQQYVYYVINLCRGDEFRKEFSYLGELLSLVPYVHIMALIATATKQSRQEICQILEMNNVALVIVPPNIP